MELTNNDAIAIINAFIGKIQLHHIHYKINELLNQVTDEEKLEIAESCLSDVTDEMTVSNALMELLRKAAEHADDTDAEAIASEFVLLITGIVTPYIPDELDRVATLTEITGKLEVDKDDTLNLRYLSIGPQIVNECVNVLRNHVLVKDNTPLIITVNYGTSIVTYYVSRMSNKRSNLYNRYNFELDKNKVFNLTACELNIPVNEAEIAAIKEKISKNMKMLNIECNFTLVDGSNEWDGFVAF